MHFMPRKILLTLGTLVIAAFAGLMLTKTLPYFTFEQGIHFLTTKSDETNDNSAFRAGFYVHITTSLLVLVAGLLQFLPVLARRGPGLHRRLGKFYIIGVLALAAPSGLILARFANGGLVQFICSAELLPAQALVVERGHAQLEIVVLLAQVVEKVAERGLAPELSPGGEDFGQLGIGREVVDAQFAALGVGVVEVCFHGA